MIIMIFITIIVTIRIIVTIKITITITIAITFTILCDKNNCKENKYIGETDRILKFRLADHRCQ